MPPRIKVLFSILFIWIVCGIIFFGLNDQTIHTKENNEPLELEYKSISIPSFPNTQTLEVKRVNAIFDNVNRNPVY